MTNYVLAPAYSAVQFWNEEKTDLIEVRRAAGQEVVPVEGISEKEAERLLKLDAIVAESDLETSDEAAPAGEPISGGAPEEPAGNASREQWVTYADALGLTVDPNAGREDIKQLVADSRR